MHPLTSRRRVRLGDAYHANGINPRDTDILNLGTDRKLRRAGDIEGSKCKVEDILGMASVRIDPVWAARATVAVGACEKHPLSTEAGRRNVL